MAKQILTLKIKESAGEIQRKLRAAIMKKLGNDRVLSSAGINAARKVQILFRKNMYASATYRDLATHGRLVAELGLEDPMGKIDVIINTWINSLKLTFRKIGGGAGGSIKGGFRIQMVRSNYADVLKLQQAKQRATSRRKPKTNKMLAWLDWLLKQGDRKIITGFDVSFRPGGRTGLAIMIEPKQVRSWGVPAEFAGTSNDNFVTRVLDDMRPEVIQIMRSELFKAVRRN